MFPVVFVLNIQMEISLERVECSWNSWMMATTLSLHPPQSTNIRHHFLTAVENTLITISAAIFNYYYAIIISRQCFLLNWESEETIILI